MSYYLESQYLNLEKFYKKFTYQSLNDDTAQQNIAFGEDQQSSEQQSYHFIQEKDMLLNDIKNLQLYTENMLANNHNENSKNFPFEQVKFRVCFIITKYQEQPALLDSLIENIITMLMNPVEQFVVSINEQSKQHPDLLTFINETKIQPEIHHIISIIYLLCKTRKYKFIVKYLQHEVRLLEPVMLILAHQINHDAELWETKYFLLLWLSMIILVPFDLSSIDSQLFKGIIKNLIQSCSFNTLLLKNQDTNNFQTIEQNLIEIAKFYLNSATLSRDASAIFLAKFFSRPDIQKKNMLENYVLWIQDTIQACEELPQYQFFITGIYKSLVEILKTGQRNELLDKIPLIMPFITNKDDSGPYSPNKNALIRLLKVKISQRIALQYLKPRRITWVYNRGSRNIKSEKKLYQTTSKLVTNVATSNQIFLKQETSNNDNQEDEETYFADVDPENLENIMDFLLNSLQDKDTNVRWSSAKGIGRITGRLNLEMADDVVSSILELFSKHENDTAWHGGCLALGELSRRGLLLPKRLEEVFPIIEKALIYDQNEGNYSVGANVRDGACYVAWAFARAYNPDVLQKYMKNLAENLLLVCLFDREVNCRRAASAAFQENVGRQGSFPHGIEILTEADYFTLGIRSNAYLNVAVFVSSFEEYYEAFVNHLAFVKLRHLDQEIRRLAAATLSQICVLNPQLILNNIIPGLIDSCTAEMVYVRHGSIYGIADILIGLAGKSHLHNMHDVMKDSVFLKNFTKNDRKLMVAGEYRQKFLQFFEEKRTQNYLNLIPENSFQQILGIIDKIEKQRLYRGKGGEIMRICVCKLIECISLAEIKLPTAHLKRYIETLDECLKNPIENIQKASVKALIPFMQVYGTDLENQFIDQFVQKLLKNCSTDPNVAITRGYSQAIGTLSQPFTAKYKDKIFQVLQENCVIKEKELDDADTRKFTVDSIQKFIESLFQSKQIDSEILKKCFELCFAVMNDYTVDKRGDIGSIVREASMQSQLGFIKSHTKYWQSQENLLTSNYIETIFRLLLQQLAEKIDRTRLVAGAIIQEIVDEYFDKIPDFPSKQLFYEKFCRKTIKELVINAQQKADQEYAMLGSINQIVDLEATTSLEDVTKEYIYHWNLPHAAFPIVLSFLSIPEYSYNIIKGMVVSVGGLTESVVKQSSKSLLNYLENFFQNQQVDIINQFFANYLKLLKECQGDERIINPALKTLEIILEKPQIVQSYEFKNFANEFYEQIKIELKGKQSILKVLSATPVFILFLQSKVEKEIKVNIFKTVHALLGHAKFPKVRKLTADKYYLFMMSQGEELFDQKLNEEFCEFILEYDWIDIKPNQLKDVKALIDEKTAKICSVLIN